MYKYVKYDEEKEKEKKLILVLGLSTFITTF